MKTKCFEKLEKRKKGDRRRGEEKPEEVNHTPKQLNTRRQNTVKKEGEKEKEEKRENISF